MDNQAWCVYGSEGKLAGVFLSEDSAQAYLDKFLINGSDGYYEELNVSLLTAEDIQSMYVVYLGYLVNQNNNIEITITDVHKHWGDAVDKNNPVYIYSDNDGIKLNFYWFMAYARSAMEAMQLVINHMLNGKYGYA